MALDPSARYPGQVDTTTDPTGYPLGAAQDITVPGDGTGTPWQKDLVNDIWGFFQAMLAAVSATATGTPDKVGASQYLSAIQSLTTTAINAVSLQAAYLRSVALAQTAPHIDVTTNSFQVGGTVDPMLFRVVNSTETSTAKKLAVLFETSLNTLAVSGITTLSAALNGTSINASGNVAVTGATSTGTLSVGGSPIASGTYTPAVSAPSGTGIDVGDFTNLAGVYSQNGKTVTFAIFSTVATTSWSGPVECVLTMPTAGTISGRVIASVQCFGASDSFADRAVLINNTGDTSFKLEIEPDGGPTGVGREMWITGMYRLT
jgi:hypothetical protein